MFSTIVVGVDARAGGRDALALAAQVGDVFGSHLVAVHAYPYDYFVSRGSESVQAVMRDAAKETLDGELRDSGVDAQAIVAPDDSPARALHRVARRRLRAGARH